MKRLSIISPLLLTLLLLLGIWGEQKVYAQCPGSVYAGEDSVICYSSSRVYLNGKVIRPNGKLSTGSWSGGTGRFIPNRNTLNAVYIPSPAEVDNGVVQLILVPTQNCFPSKDDTLVITFNRVIDPPISGPLGICEFSSGHSYSVPQESGVSYQWHIVGGSINSGQGTHEVDVTWGAKGPGYIYVMQTDAHGCSGLSSIEPISRFHFNTTDYKKASVGPNAISVNSDAMGDGIGLYIDNNCGPTKGLDLTIPGSAFDRGKMCMTFSWQRDESEASFFQRGGTEFFISGGILRVKLTQKDSIGNAKVVGPINTGYSVPNDDNFRHFTFCYDSASGIARVLVNDSLVWNYETGTHSSLHWTGAGNAVIGSIMDGNCSQNTLLDWVNVSIPISIYPKPTSTISGDTLLCKNSEAVYTGISNAYTQLDWNAGTHGTIVGPSNTAQVTAGWNQSGLNYLNLVVTDSRNGCDSSIQHAVTIAELPQFHITGTDSLCLGDSAILQINGSATNPIWTFASDTISGTQYQFKALQEGNFSLYLQATDSLNFCSNTDTLSIYVQQNPNPQLIIPNKICLGEASSLQDTTQYPWSVSHQWQITSGQILSGQTNSESLIIYQQSGTFSGSLTVREPKMGCETIESFQLKVMPKPVTGNIQFD